MSVSSSTPPHITRRSAAKLLGGALLSSLATSPLARTQQPAAPSPTYTRLLSDEDLAFLEEMEQAACLYFSEQVEPSNGQVLDRASCKNSTGEMDSRFVSSIAATGFGLTALCISDKRSYYPTDRLKNQVITTLDFHLNKMPNEHGFFYHFNDVKTGKPLINSEVSSIDTAILLCGVLTARAYFNDPKVTELATQLYNRVDWQWMLNGGKTFSMGWRPETGFISTRWDHYSELMMLYLLAIGSPANPISPECWSAFTRPPMTFGPYSFISGKDPLFVHQFSHAWFDFARQRDAYADYFVNSIAATRAHKAFCLGLNRGYSDDYWGVSASDWEHGYTAWGGPPLQGPVDGSVVPCATAGSLPFLPRECVASSAPWNSRQRTPGAVRLLRRLPPRTHWYDPEVLGIDLGIQSPMAEKSPHRLRLGDLHAEPEPCRRHEPAASRATKQRPAQPKPTSLTKS
jgi:hypothetical protein